MSSGPSVLQNVGSSGEVSFAGTVNRVGSAHRGEQVVVRLVGDTDGGTDTTNRIRVPAK